MWERHSRCRDRRQGHTSCPESPPSGRQPPSRRRATKGSGAPTPARLEQPSGRSGRRRRPDKQALMFCCAAETAPPPGIGNNSRNRYTAWLSLERCRSGRTGLTRNQVYPCGYRGFESHPLRQFSSSYVASRNWPKFPNVTRVPPGAVQDVHGVLAAVRRQVRIALRHRYRGASWSG